MDHTNEYLVDLILLYLLYVLFCRRRWAEQGQRVLLIRSLIYVYLIVLLFFTLMPVITAIPHMGDHAYVPMHLMPFNDYIHGWGDATRQIVLNVVMTVPFGFLFPLTQGKRRWLLLKTVLFAFLLSLCIELLQPLLHADRSSDVTDLITNTVGGLGGYLLYLLCRPVTEKVLAALCGE